LLTVHENIAYNYDELKKEYITIIKDKIIKPYGTTHIQYEEQLKVYEEIRAEFYELQNKKEFGVACSIRFIILTMFSYSGNTKINDDLTFQFTKESVYNEKGLLATLSIPIRLKKFNEIYNKFDIEFRFGNAFDLLEEYKNNQNVLLNMDPPYVKEDRSKEMTENTIIIGVGIEYGQQDFSHERLVKDYLNCTNFIYNNNIHPFLLDYEKKYNLHSTIHDRPNSNSRVEKGEKRDIVREIILWENKALKN
jgi:site-specific DNA-adenine methylase